MADESSIPTADGRQDIAKLASLADEAVVARTRPESHALVVTFSRDGEEPEEMFASDDQRAWRNAVTLIAKRERLLSGDTLTIRRADEDLIVEIIRRPQGEATASNPTTLNFQTSGGATTIEADTTAERVRHYSIFDRTPADIDDPDLAGDLGHLAASLDYLDYLARAQQAAARRRRARRHGLPARRSFR